MNGASTLWRPRELQERQNIPADSTGLLQATHTGTKWPRWSSKYSRMMIKTEWRSKVVAAVWGTEATPAIFFRDDLKKRIKRITASWRNRCFGIMDDHPVHTIAYPYPISKWMFSQNFLFKSSLLLNGKCGIQVCLPTISDELCLLFCLNPSSICTVWSSSTLTCPIHWIWHRQSTSCSRKYRRSWLASNWQRRGDLQE